MAVKGGRGDFSIDMETRKFNRMVQELVNKYPEKADIIIKKFAVDLLSRILRKNPVLTGRSRAGWYASMSGLRMPKMDMKTGPKYDPKEVIKGKREGRFVEHKSRFSHYVELINGVKYILQLEYGKSNQAPFGMVRVSIRELSGDKLPREMGAYMKHLWKRSIRF